MEIDSVKAVKDCFSLALRDKKTWKYVFVQYAFGIITLVVFFAALVGLFGSAALGLFFGGAQANPSQFLQNIVAGISLLIAIIIIYIIINILFYSAISVLVTNRALELNGLRTETFSFSKVISAIVLGILTFFLAVLSVYSKRLMIIALLFVFAWILAFFSLVFFQSIAVIFFAAGLLLAIPYFFILVYNALRLSLSLQVFLESNTPLFESTRKSWDITHGNVLMVFFAGLILFIIVFAVSVLVSIPPTIVSIVNPFAGNILGFIFNFFLQPVFIVLGFFLPANIYAQLKGMTPAQGFSATPQTQGPKWLAKK